MSDFKQSLHPILWAYRLTGLTMFEIPEDVPWPKLSALYVFALGSCYSYVLWCRLNMSIESEEIVPLVSVVFHIVLIFNVITAFASSVIYWLHRKDRLEVIRRIKLVDETLQSFGMDPKYKDELRENQRMILLVLIALALLLASGIVIYSNLCDTLGAALIPTFTFFWPQVLNILVESTFMIILALLQKRFEKLNALLSNAVRNSFLARSYQNINKYRAILLDNQLYDETSASYYAKNRTNLEYLLPTTRQLHSDLCSICRLVNRIMGIQIAMQMAVKFVLLIGYSYAFYLLYKEKNVPLQMKLCFHVFVIIRITYGAIRLYFTIRTSENITAEAQRTSQIAQEIEDNRQEILKDIHQYSLQIMHNPLYFTAYGLYVLDFNFVRSFAGSVAFYLIILIQNQPSISETAEAIIADVNPTTTP